MGGGKVNNKAEKKTNDISSSTTRVNEKDNERLIVHIQDISGHYMQ
jgi:hypothetical protein